MDLYLTKLKKAGLSNTKPRLTIFNLLKNNGHQPYSVNQLVYDCKVFADRSTVYRSIKNLESAGIIKRVYQGWKYKLELSDDFHGHHHHIMCTKCKKVNIINETTELKKIINELAKNNNYIVSDHNLEVQGICRSCQT